MHLLAMILSVLTSLCFWFWANQPIWTQGPYEVAQFYHVHPENKQVTSFVKASGKWHLETRDFITGEFLRTVEVLLPKSLAPHMCFPNTAPHQVEHALVVIQGRYTSGNLPRTGYGMVVVDASTGKLLTRTPIEVDASAIPVCFGTRAVIPHMNEALFFEYGKEPLRVLSIRYGARITLLDDNEHLLTTDGEFLQIIPWSTGWVKSRGAHQQKLMNFPRLTQLPDKHLLVSAYEYDGGIKLRMEYWRWDGTTLEKLGKSIVLTPPENSTIKYAATYQVVANIDRQGNIHLPTFQFTSWPAPFRSLLTWCSTQGWNVCKYIPHARQTIVHVLNVKNEVIGRYERESNFDMLLSTGTAIRYQRAELRAGSYTIKAMRTLPQWPNAMALGIIVYLLWYVYHRLRVGHAVRASTG
jgi:hypothetical protein